MGVQFEHSTVATGDDDFASASEIRQLTSVELPDEVKTRIREQTWKRLKADGDAANRRDLALWRAVDSRETWEAFRDQRIKRLRQSLGEFPPVPKQIDVHVTGEVQGDGFVVKNVVYETRTNFWVTANLYQPAKPNAKMPGILLVHSHHRPKTQGELQDMGMTWARAGCLVLVIDLVGHGERAAHPFQGEDDYPKENSGFKWWRQDYYFRYDTNTQLHLAGESLMGWNVWDLMRGVDVLHKQPGLDEAKVMIIGAVAGGGDPAAVAAALDPRIAAAVPFNFGGPQPETVYPLPEDADLHFNYLGGAYWEGTRNLRRTGVDGFFHWTIVGSIAPRPLIYAHEFSWDKDRDPVWKRLNKIYGYYDAKDNLAAAFGRGSVKGRPPEATHCTNVGAEHRMQIHPAFKRWFDIHVSSEDEFSQRLDASDLRSMTDKIRQQLKPKKHHEVLQAVVSANLEKVRREQQTFSATQRRQTMQAYWKDRLGDIEPRDDIQEQWRKTDSLAGGKITAELTLLKTGDDFLLPVRVLSPTEKKDQAKRVVVAVSQAGSEAFLKHRSQEIVDLLAEGAAVCLVDLRDTGGDRGSHGNGGNGSTSHYALFFDTPMVGHRLCDLRSVMRYLRTREDLNVRDFAMWGESFTPPNARDTDLRVPWRVSGRPRFSEPLGGLLAMLAALFEDDVAAIQTGGSLVSYADVLSDPNVFIPHDVVVPGAIVRHDLPDLVAALAPRPVRIEAAVDGLNRLASIEMVEATYQPATSVYAAFKAEQALEVSLQRTSPTACLVGRAVGD